MEYEKHFQLPKQALLVPENGEQIVSGQVAFAAITGHPVIKSCILETTTTYKNENGEYPRKFRAGYSMNSSTPQSLAESCISCTSATVWTHLFLKAKYAHCCIRKFCIFYRDHIQNTVNKKNLISYKKEVSAKQVQVCDTTKTP